MSLRSSKLSLQHPKLQSDGEGKVAKLPHFALLTEASSFPPVPKVPLSLPYHLSSPRWKGSSSSHAAWLSVSINIYPRTMVQPRATPGCSFPTMTYLQLLMTQPLCPKATS